MQYDGIKQQFDEVIAYSQNISNPQTDELFKDWLEAKRDFIELFNGKLIYEWPQTVTFELSEADKMKKLDDFIWQIESTYHNSRLSEFISVFKEDFFENRMSKSYTKDDIFIKSGMKVIKAFKYFVEGEELEILQNWASRLIQENKVSGTLCLSVHPLDFLSTSENTYNWRSCHALDGEYRCGNLSYMVDKATIICYLKGDKEENLPNFPSSIKWNSKKWRVLLYFSECWDMLFAGRQYPFSSESGLDFVKNQVLPRAGFNKWSNFTDKTIHQFSDGDIELSMSKEYIPNGNGYLVPITDIIHDFHEYHCDPIHFNDLLRSSCYNPKYAFRMEEHYWYNKPFVSMKSNPFMTVGGGVRCLRCGHTHVTSQDTMMCDSCEMEYGNSEDYVACDCCGRRIYYEDSIFLPLYEEHICEDCYNERISTCVGCEEELYNDDIVIDEETRECYCHNCYDAIMENKKSKTRGIRKRFIPEF